MGDRVAVIGLGLLGQLALRLAAAAGAIPWGVDLSADRVKRARMAGYEAVMREGADQAGHLATDKIGFDCVLILAASESSDPIELAGELARERGRVIAVGEVGLQVPRRLFYEKELSLTVSRSYGPGRYDPSYEEHGQDYPIGYVRWTIGRNLSAVADLLESGKLAVTDLISHRFDIEQAPRAYQVLQRGESSGLGILLTYPPDREGEPRKIQYRGQSARDGLVRVGVLGAGNFARSTALPAMKRTPDLKLAGIVSGAGLSSASAAGRFGFEFAAPEEDDLYQDDSLDVIAVLTRHHQHARQVQEALRSGKHVFCEKPPALNPEELMSLTRVLEEAPGQVFTVGYNRRFAPLSQSLLAFTGNPTAPCTVLYRVNAGALPAEHWLLDPQVGGGRLIGECGHFIDLMSAVVGADPARVSAAQSAARAPDPSFSVQIEYDNGSIGTLVYATSGTRRLPKERLEYFGSGKAAVLDDFRRLELISGAQRRVERSWFRQDKGHRALWHQFVLAVKGAGPPVPYQSLFLTSAVTFAAQASMERGETVDLVEFLAG